MLEHHITGTFLYLFSFREQLTDSCAWSKDSVFMENIGSSTCSKWSTCTTWLQFTYSYIFNNLQSHIFFWSFLNRSLHKFFMSLMYLCLMSCPMNHALPSSKYSITACRHFLYTLCFSSCLLTFYLPLPLPLCLSVEQRSNDQHLQLCLGTDNLSSCSNTLGVA
jgi:hypothetical protein